MIGFVDHVTRWTYIKPSQHMYFMSLKGNRLYVTLRYTHMYSTYMDYHNVIIVTYCSDVSNDFNTLLN